MVSFYYKIINIAFYDCRLLTNIEWGAIFNVYGHYNRN